MRLIHLGIVCLCCMLHPATGMAGQTRWVSDQLPLDMRSGNSNAYRVIKMLDPGTKVSVLKVDEQTQFSQIVTADGSKGWLANRYLMSEPSGREQLAKAQSTITQLRQGSDPMRTRLAELEQELSELQKKLADATAEREQAEQQLSHIQEVSANAMQLDSSNQSLMEENQLLQHEIDVLEGENSRLKDSSSSAWFIKGALAVGLGALLALAIPHLSPSRKNKEWR